MAKLSPLPTEDDIEIVVSDFEGIPRGEGDGEGRYRACVRVKSISFDWIPFAVKTAPGWSDNRETAARIALNNFHVTLQEEEEIREYLRRKNEAPTVAVFAPDDVKIK